MRPERCARERRFSTAAIRPRNACFNEARAVCSGKAKGLSNGDEALLDASMRPERCARERGSPIE